MDLTQDQVAFLAECEKEFCDRYTDKDTEYMELKNKPLSNPPIVYPWNGGQQRQPTLQKGIHQRVILRL